MGALTALSLMACERRPLEDISEVSSLVPVKIDWSNSGLSVSPADGDDYVHRVSLRFFPKDGSAAFDRYLEGNVTEGSIDVPPGSYSVVVFNEAIDDPYWSGALTFTDVNDYSKFAANVAGDDASVYSFYQPFSSEKIVTAPLSLASWSLDNFEITPQMLQTENLSAEPMTTALTSIVMRRLTYNVNVTANVENLVSAQLIQGAVRGFSNKVYMASGATEEAPSTHIFTFDIRKLSAAGSRNGTTEKNFLSFGQAPSPGQYALSLGVVLVTGEVYAAHPLAYDVSPQVNSYVHSDIYIRVNLTLPYKEGGINIDDWDEEEHPVN